MQTTDRPVQRDADVRSFWGSVREVPAPCRSIVFRTTLAIEAVIVTVLWGPRTLTRYERRAYAA